MQEEPVKPLSQFTAREFYKYPHQTNLTAKQNAEISKVRTAAVKKYYGSTKEYFTSDPEKISKEYGQLLDSTYSAMQKIQAEGNLGRLARGQAIEQPRQNKFVDTLKRTFGRKAGADIIKNPDQLNNSNNPAPSAVQPKTKPIIDPVNEIKLQVQTIAEDLNSSKSLSSLDLGFISKDIETTVKKVEDLQKSSDCSQEDVIFLCDKLQEICSIATNQGMSHQEAEEYSQRLDAVKEDAQHILQSGINYL